MLIKHVFIFYILNLSELIFDNSDWPDDRIEFFLIFFKIKLPAPTIVSLSINILSLIVELTPKKQLSSITTEPEIVT